MEFSADTSIFGVEPPRWLQQLAKPADMSTAAKDAGIFFGAGLLAMQKDPDKTGVNPDTGNTYSWLESRKGFNQETLSAARKGIEDPNWRLKTKALEAQTSGQLAQNKAAWLNYDTQVRDNTAWAEKDLPALYKYRDEVKTNPSAAPPVMESSQGQKAIGLIDQFLLRKSQQDWVKEYQKGNQQIKRDQLEHNASMQRLDGAFKEGFSRLDPTTGASIRQQVEASGEEWADKDGFLSPAAQVAIGSALNDMGLPGVSSFAQREALQEQRGQTQVDVAKIGAASREKVEGMREKGRAETEKAKGQLRTLQIQYNIKQKRLENLAKDPVLSMAPDSMGKTMAAVRKKKEEELSKLSTEVDSLAEKMDVLSNQIETGPAEPGTDYRPGTMNPAPPLPKVNTPEQAKEAIDQANAALKKIGNNKELRQKVLDKLKQLGVDFTLGTNAPAASTNATANP
jgi:hypothetical protein